MLDAIKDILIDVIYAISSLYVHFRWFRTAVLSALGIWSFHHVAYTLIGMFFTRKFKPAKNNHKYAILIAARNEEAVIGNLLDSIKEQDYPSDLLTVFVVADNCTDATAKIARDKGAICYERFNDKERTKGFALRFLFENIKKDYGIESFEGYFIFDADNLLNKNYITKMNDSFDSGVKIITSYRNTKNFDENWVAASYALHWLRSIRTRHRARSVLRLATNIQGTGFLFASELVKDGWRYTSLTEDRAFTADAVAMGYQISYNDEAVFYDEQPTKIKVALRQRLRWSKGHLMAFQETGWKLFKNIFTGNRYIKRDKSKKYKLSDFIESVRFRFASFDTLSQLFPSVIVKLFLWLLVAVFMYACINFKNGINDSHLFGSNTLATILKFIFGDIVINVGPGVTAALYAVLLTIFWNIVGRINFHFEVMALGIYVFFMERRRIIKIPFYKKVWFVLTWPAFDAIHRWTTYVALFMKVEWKPIPHTSKITIHDIEK